MENRALKVKLLVQYHITNEYRQNKNPSLGLSVTGTQVLYHYFKLLLINHLITLRDGDVFVDYGGRSPLFTSRKRLCGITCWDFP